MNLDDYEVYRGIADRMFSKQQLDGYPTGFSSLDAYVHGIRPGTLTILAGGTGMGKSLFALNVLVNLARRQIDSEYFDLENSRTLSFQRLVSIWSGKAREFFMDEVNKTDAIKTMYEFSEHISYMEKQDLGAGQDTFANLMKWLNVSKAKVILIDPLQTLESETDSSSAFNEQGKIVRELKEFAQNKNKAVILCHHLRKGARAGEWVTDMDDVRETKYQVPSIEDLKGSGKIADYATDVWGIIRTKNAETKEGRGKTRLRILKNRSGLTGDIDFHFNEDTLHFMEKNRIYEKDEVINFLERSLYE